MGKVKRFFQVVNANHVNRRVWRAVALALVMSMTMLPVAVVFKGSAERIGWLVTLMIMYGLLLCVYYMVALTITLIWRRCRGTLEYPE